MIIVGFALIASGWRHLYAAQKAGRLAASGPYRRIRHPQYSGFLAIMVGFLLMWPTLPTLVMFPVLIWVYRRLALREEAEVAARFGARWERYAAKTPRFVPSLRPRSPGRPAHRPTRGPREESPEVEDVPEVPRTTTRSRTGGT